MHVHHLIRNDGAYIFFILAKYSNFEECGIYSWQENNEYFLSSWEGSQNIKIGLNRGATAEV